MGWQPSRFLTDRGEAERAFQLAQQLGSVNAAATELGTTWPSLRKAFGRHGLGTPAPNPQAVRQRAVDAARRRAGQPGTPSLDPVFVALNPGALPARLRSEAEPFQWVRREEQYATLGASVVVELYSESHACRPTTRAWAIIRRAQRAHRRAIDRRGRSERRQADRTSRTDRSHQARAGPRVGGDRRCPLTGWSRSATTTDPGRIPQPTGPALVPGPAAAGATDRPPGRERALMPITRDLGGPRRSLTGTPAALGALPVWDDCADNGEMSGN